MMLCCGRIECKTVTRHHSCHIDEHRVCGVRLTIPVRLAVAAARLGGRSRHLSSTPRSPVPMHFDFAIFSLLALRQLSHEEI